MADPDPGEMGRKIEEILGDLRSIVAEAMHRGPDRLLSIRSAAEVLDCSPDHLRHLIADGEIPAHNIAQDPDRRPMYRIRTSDLAAYIVRVTGSGE